MNGEARNHVAHEELITRLKRHGLSFERRLFLFRDDDTENCVEYVFTLQVLVGL